jgi:transcriptional regulator with XRE-family HTH domain
METETQLSPTQQQVKNTRSRLGYTLRRVADAIEVSPQVVSQWEQGEGEPSSKLVKRMLLCPDPGIKQMGLELYYLKIHPIATLAADVAATTESA